MGGKSGGSQITGYRYSFDIHGGIARGPIDEIVRIKVGDQIAWSGSIVDNQTISINKPNLFGGDKKEGGIVGSFTAMMGAPTQTPNSAMTTIIKGLLPAFRGMATWFYTGQVCSNNPYPKAWQLRVRRARKGWSDDDPWYPQTAVIYLTDPEDPSDVIHAMNGAHIIYEVLTNKSWGRGYSRTRINEESFIYAANLMTDEGLGLCLRWNRQEETVGAFIQNVLNHIAGALYVDRQSGKITLRLLRNDYNPDDIPTFDFNSGLLAIEDDESGSQDNLANEVIVKFRQVPRDQDRMVRVQSAAGFQATQSVLSVTIDYAGIPCARLAVRVAQRELKARSTPLKRFKLVCDRRAWKIAPGSVLKLHAPTRGIDSLVVRVGKPEESPFDENRITLQVVQDVFGMPSSAFSTPQTSTSEAPDASASAPEYFSVFEISYRDLVRNLTPADFLTVSDDQGALGVIAGRPTPLSTSYDLWSKTSLEPSFADRGDGFFCPYGLTDAAVGPYETSLTLVDAVDLDNLATLPCVGLLGTEIVQVTSVNPTTGAVTVVRGCADTVPLDWDEGTPLLIYEDFLAADDRDYVTGDIVEGRPATRTLGENLDVELAPEGEVTFVARQFRPYPPGAVEVNGDPYATAPAQTSDIVFTWDHRNRVLIDDNLVGHEATGGTAEAGQTYNIRILDGVTVLRSATAISGTTWTYLHADWVTDGSVGTITVELESERDGMTSYTMYAFLLDVS